MKIFKNKKAASIDNFFAVVTFFALAIFFLVLMVAWNVIGATEIFSATASSEAVTIKNNMDNAYNNFDFMLLAAYFGLHLGILALAYLLRTHPVIFVAAIILTGILALIAAPISNAYEDITQENELTTAANDIPKTNFIMKNLPKFEIIWALITMIVMFGFARSEGFV